MPKKIHEQLTPIPKKDKHYGTKYVCVLYPRWSTGLNWYSRDTEGEKIRLPRGRGFQVNGEDIKFQEGVFIPEYLEECEEIESHINFKLGRIRMVPIGEKVVVPSIHAPSIGIKPTQPETVVQSSTSNDAPTVVEDEDAKILGKRG